jgi:RNA 2',3'-cyclic 3'-phosphodiesterase
MARLFFALRPAEPAARALARAAADLAPRIGGRAVPMANIHLTLAFLGDVDPARIDAARAAGDETRGAAFDLTLERLGVFRKAGVAWAGSSTVDPALAALQASLAASLQGRGFVLEERPFNPHVTLVRKARQPLPQDRFEAVAWRVAQFALLRSELGAGRYQTLESWTLG